MAYAQQAEFTPTEFKKLSLQDKIEYVSWKYGQTVQQTLEANELCSLTKSGQFENFKQRINQENCNLRSQDSTVPLMHAVNADRDAYERCQHLLSLKANLQVTSIPGWTVLHYAAAMATDDRIVSLIASLIASASPSAINAQDCDGHTPLMLAVQQGNDVAVEKLLEFDADTKIRSNEQETALQIAKRIQDSRICANIIENFSKKHSTERRHKRKHRHHQHQSPSSSSTSYDADNSSSSSTKESASGFKAINYYPVTQPLGLCLIINITKYTAASQLTERNEATVDISRLSSLFTKLGFKVELKEDLTAEKIDKYLHKASQMQHFGNFVCFILAHATKENVFGIDGKSIAIQDLIKNFRTSNCDKLIGKPKIFIILNCRGDQRNVNVMSCCTTTSSSQGIAQNQHPQEIDFLLYFVKNDISLQAKDACRSSAFIQALCTVVEAEHRLEDLVSLLTKISDRMHQREFVTIAQHSAIQIHDSITERFDTLTKKVTFNGKLFD